MSVMNRLLSDRRILVVEDEMMILMLIEDMLSDLGCTAVTTAATVPKALALIDVQVFDAAMLDMNLNSDKSHLVADALAARHVPFFFSTGYSGRDMRVGYRDHQLLTKPFQIEKLAEIFTSLIPRQVGN